MPTETVTPQERVSPEERARDATAADDAAERLAARHREQVRKFRLSLSVYVLSMLVLVPVWAVTQYESSPGWPEHLSSRSRYPGDWDPWIIWLGLVGAILVGIAGFRAYASRPGAGGKPGRRPA